MINLTGALYFLENDDENTESLSDRVNIIRHKLKFIDQKPRVAVIAGLSPMLAAGSLICELVSIAGGIPVPAPEMQERTLLDERELFMLDPEVIIVCPQDYAPERTLSAMNELFTLETWSDLPAVKNSRVYIADGRRFLNLNGPELVDDLEMLAEMIQPKQFIFGGEGERWMRFG